MTFLNRHRSRIRPVGPFAPSSLFFGGIPGAWYDPTDLSTMFQDSAGTTPVTAVEQPVGLILDKSGNGNHASQSTAASRPTYRARYNLLTYSEQFDNAVWFRQALAGVTANAAVAPDGTTTADLVIADNTSTSTHRIASTPAVTTISGTSHTFSVYAKKSGAYEGLALTVDAPAVYVAFDLTNGVAGAGGTITNVGNGWFRCSVTFTAGASTLCRVWTFDTYANAAAQSAWTGNGTTGILLWGAQLLTAADVTATGNAYQRIAAATVYDTAPIFRPYLAFDGMDDSLSTAAINFTSTDKMTVFIGVNKQSDAVALIAEISPTVNTNAGSFGIGVNTGPNYFSALNGNALAFYTETTYTAPATNVVTTSFDIAGAAIANEIFPRVNAAIPTLAATGANAGTGNFGNWPLYIASRAGSGVRLTGRLYSLIVRGAASSVTEIADTELWVNARTGAF